MRFRLVIQILVVVCLFAFVSSKAWSELVIKVTQGNDTPSIIAIPPIVLKGSQLSEDVSAIIEADLERSGFFKVVDRNNMLAFPSAEDDIYFRDWRLLGSEYLVVGSVTEIQRSRFELSFSLINVNSQKILFRHSVGGTKDQLRD